MNNPALERFCDEFKALLERWMEKPGDDRLSYAELHGTMYSVANVLSVRVADMDQGEPEDDE